MAFLPCPLCGVDAAAGGEPADGRCSGCGAHYAGGGQSAPEGVSMALAAWGVDDLDPAILTRRLFESDPAPAPAPTAAITSDRRAGFYLWWLFVRAGQAGVGATLHRFSAPSR